MPWWSVFSGSDKEASEEITEFGPPRTRLLFFHVELSEVSRLADAYDDHNA